MIPKAEIIAIPSDIKRRDLVEVFDSGLTRLPVYKGTLDSAGRSISKISPLQHGFNGKGRAIYDQDAAAVAYAPPSMPIGVLLQRCRRTGCIWRWY
jgi:magnesium and cobalt transporter